MEFIAENGGGAVEAGGHMTPGAGVSAIAMNLLPLVLQIQASGATTLRAIAEALNARGIRTARGGAWHSSTVGNLLARAN